ncbi:uncharacterized protein LOC108623877 [Ceratina calcarata]|uniref:Uncharacterized protein LOC108623877 n=1 Tax=Ceratina calcarata TaxID=156304 RepID=A0AAJ7W9V1_9HYME|nr:uncharacterized protein LOC108623877 [Ceratina calcarata]XP_026668448.1 uncharacterized protein LOC108623877 [Ceratina calcarata]XP_026668449.1 uncharacterized protein LOC108623877 [Ceratina calcarata]XP_026668450.1 uncharacterized protein LOC108623877 [Ceratina calcarata]
MSKKQWLVLLMLFLTYLLLGASIFYHIESRLEIKRVEEARRERIEINAMLHEHYVPNGNQGFEKILKTLSDYCGKSVRNYTDDEQDPLKWDFYNSFYFAYTVVSTIGYGNLAPTTMLSRILMIFYGLIGIPMNGILLSQLGEFFGNVFVQAHQKYKSYKRNRNDYDPRKFVTFEKGKFGLVAQILIHLLPGFVMFIFFPAFLFSYYEGWNYDEAVYYAFVTLTTIGFGDYVAGDNYSRVEINGLFFTYVYKIFLIGWISFGLGYTVMILTFIGRGMRSKKIARIEHKLAVNLKHTQSKIWNEFNKEIDYLRRVFNELQLSKVRRVYVDECNSEVPVSKIPRSSSMPDLRSLFYGLKEKDTPCYKPRRRANSEVVPMESEVKHVVSETDLQRIDKTATFASHAIVQPAELLARLVNILGYIPPATDDINEVGSDQTTYVVNEKEHGKTSNSGQGMWAIGHDKIPRFGKPRSRAASEIRLQDTRREDPNIERTWSGPTAARKMHELMKARANEESGKDRSIKESKFAKLRSFALSKTVPKALSSSWRNRFSQSSDKKNSECDNETKDPGQSYSIDDNRDSYSATLNPRPHYFTHTGAGNNFNAESGNNLLEETSLADFLRALTVLHASVATSGSWTPATNDDPNNLKNHPRRKMGTASLTPPKLPSLFTLFSPSPPVSNSQSNENTITEESIENKPRWSQIRRQDPPTVAKTRRFSLRPVATPISPPTPPRVSSPFLSNSRRVDVPASSDPKSQFLIESPKVPLIQTEGAPGLSSPVKSSVDARRLSLRSTQNVSPITGTTVPTGIPTLKGAPRWKAGMLQRQISQMNLRRRVRAFSLSDVHADDSQDGTESSSVYRINNRDIFRRNVSSRDDERSGQLPSVNRPDSISQPTCSANSTRLPETNVSIGDIDSSNSRSGSGQVQLVLSNDYRADAEKQMALNPLMNPEYVRASTDMELQQPLMEIKVENPDPNKRS